MGFAWARARIANRIIILVITLELFSIGLWGTLTYSASKRELLGSLNSQLREAALRTRTEIAQVFTPFYIQAEITSTTVEALKLTLERREVLFNFLLKARDEIEDLSFIRADGTEELRLSRVRSFGSEDLRSMADDPLFQSAASGVFSTSDILFSEYFEPQMKIAIPVAKRRSDAPTPVIMALINLKWLSQIVQAQSVGETGYVYVVNGDFKLIGHNDPSLVLSELLVTESEVPTQMFTGEGTSEFTMYNNFDGIPVAGASIFDPVHRWWVAVEIPVSEAMAPLERIVQRFVVVFILAATVTVVAVLAFSRLTMRPLGQFANAIKRISEGERQVRLDVSPGSELAFLGGAFNTMAERLDDTIAALTRGEETLALALAGGTAWPWDWDLREGKFRHSPEWAHALGYADDELEQLPIHPDDREHFDPETPGGAMLTRALDAEVRVRTQDGRWRWMLARGKVVSYKTDGTPERAVGTFTDITEQKHADQKLRESEQRFRYLIEGSIQGIFIHRRWRTMFANQAFCDIFGYESPAAVSATDKLMTHFAPYVRERLLHDQDTLTTDKSTPTRYEFDAKRLDGTTITLEAVVRRVSWEGLPAVQATLVDISKRKRAMDALRKSQFYYLDLYENAPDSFASFDVRTGKAIECNTTLSKRLGVSKAEILATHAIELVHPQSRRAAHRTFSAFMRDGEVRRATLCLLGPNGGELKVSVNASAARDPDGNILYARATLRVLDAPKQAVPAQPIKRTPVEPETRTTSNNPPALA